MPTIPKNTNLEKTSKDVLNTVWSQQGQEYQKAIPKASGTLENLRMIGQAFAENEGYKNDFLNALVNRIGRVLITSRLYDNPWAIFKKGIMEYGETVEEVFVGLIDPQRFNPEVAENEVFKRVIPDVKATFHTMNSQEFYKITVSEPQLRQAFLSYEGVSDLIARIIEQVYTSANYDELVTMKYMLGQAILEGKVKLAQIPEITEDNSRRIVSGIKGVSNEMSYMSSDFNNAGVTTYSDKSSQYVIMNSRFDAVVDVEVLALSFNMNVAEFIGHRVGINTFSLNVAEQTRLQKLFKDEPGFTMPTDEQLAFLEGVPAVILDRDWFMVFDNYINMTEQRNGQGLYWNYYYHLWKTFSISPYSNGVAFIPGTITGVTTNPTTLSIFRGESDHFIPSVTGTGIFTQGVSASFRDKPFSTGTYIQETTGGYVVYCGPDEKVLSNFIYVISVQDKTKRAEIPVTFKAQ